MEKNLKSKQIARKANRDRVDEQKLHARAKTEYNDFM